MNRFYRPYGLAHSSGVMGKIVDHRNLTFFPPDFLPSFYPIKGFQGTGDDIRLTRLACEPDGGRARVG